MCGVTLLADAGLGRSVEEDERRCGRSRAGASPTMESMRRDAAEHVDRAGSVASRRASHLGTCASAAPALIPRL